MKYVRYKTEYYTK